jgi:hypothetical protein
MKKRISNVFILLCALASLQAKAQSTHWDAIYSTPQNSYPAYCFYNDTASNSFYIGGNGILDYDGSTLSQVGSGTCPGLMRNIIKYNGTFFLGGVCYGKELMKWNGTNWDTTGLAVNGFVSCFYIYNNELYVGGNYTSIAGINSNGLAKYDGTNWTDISGFPFSYCFGIYAMISYNNELYIGGAFGDSTNNPVNIARWNGSQWNWVAGGFHGGVDDVTSFDIMNNQLYIGGDFKYSDGNVGNLVAKWDGTTLSDVGGGLWGAGAQVWDIMTYNNSLYAVGSFVNAGGVPAPKIAKWDGTDWCGLGDTIYNTIVALGEYNGDLYIAGGFSIVSCGDTTYYCLAKWNGGNYVNTCGNMTGTNFPTPVIPSVSIYPNPANETAVFNFSGISGDAIIRLYDGLGREVWYEKINGSETVLTVSGFASGVYFYRLEQGDKNPVSGKLIIQ